MILISIFNNPFLLVTWVLLAVLPAYYLNKPLLRLVRPRESIPRFLAYLIIVIAFTLLYTSIVIFVLSKTVFSQ
jgi:predicted tellurium resistance membrane protein TerC